MSNRRLLFIIAAIVAATISIMLGHSSRKPGEVTVPWDVEVTWVHGVAVCPAHYAYIAKRGRCVLQTE